MKRTRKYRPVWTTKVYKDGVYQFSEKHQRPERVKWWQFWK